MPLSGVTNVGNTNMMDESNKTHYMALSETDKKKTSKNISDNGADLERAAIAVDISESGQNINQLQKDLEKIDDPEARKKAQSGLDKAMTRLSEKGDKEVTEQFISKAKEMQDTDAAAFARALKEFDEAIAEDAKEAEVEEESKFDQWLDKFLANRPADA